MKKLSMIITIVSVFGACKNGSSDLQTNKVTLADTTGNYSKSILNINFYGIYISVIKLLKKLFLIDKYYHIQKMIIYLRSVLEDFYFLLTQYLSICIIFN